MCTSGEEIARNVYGINLISRESGNQTVNYLYNGHGDVTSLIDQSGEILASYYYDVYGKITEQTGNFDNSITFSGYTLDSETGLYYLSARMYNPDDARFLQEDTYKGNPTDILSLNIYTYCVGNPLKYIDPTGHTAINSTAAITSGTVCSGSALTGEAVNNGAICSGSALTGEAVNNGAICSGSALTGEAVNNGAICSGFAFIGGATNCEGFVVESFNEYFANRKLTVCAVFDWMTKLWGELVSQTPQEVLQDLRNSFALPDNLKSSFADTLAYLNDIKEEVAVVTTATVLIAGGVMMMHCSPSVGTGLVNAGFNVATKAVVEFAQNGKVTGSFSDYVKTGVAGFAAGTLSVAIANYGAAAGVTGVGKSLLASAGDMAADAATQYILKGKIDPKEVVVSGLTSFVCAEGFRQASRITSNLKSTKALKNYSYNQKVVVSEVNSSNTVIIPQSKGQKGYTTFARLKTGLGGPAGKGRAWHHIVEQTPSNIERFGPEMIHNTKNVANVPHGRRTLHARLSGYYSSTEYFTDGKTVRNWLSTQSYDEQYEFGMKKLLEFAEELGIQIIYK